MSQMKSKKNAVSRYGFLMILIVVSALVLAACGGGAAEPEPTAAPAPTEAPAEEARQQKKRQQKKPCQPKKAWLKVWSAVPPALMAPSAISILPIHRRVAR